MKMQYKIPSIAEEDVTPTVKVLLEIIEHQQILINELREEIEILKEDIKRIKGHKGKPKISPSQMDKETSAKKKIAKAKRAGSVKRKKTFQLDIHEEKKVCVEDVPSGSVRKGYQDYVVQDLIIKAHTTLYRLERWRLPDGTCCVAKLPDNLQGHHFGATLRSFVDYQHHKQHVTQPALLDQLRAFGIDISAGQLNRLLTEGKESFHQEKASLLSTGFQVSSYINVDDTGARHQGKNGYCTHIGNEFFAWFESTGSKSRINFLELLRASHQDYILDDNAFAYMKKQKLPQTPLSLLGQGVKFFLNKTTWEEHLARLGIKAPRLIRIATEGALVGSVLSHGFHIDLKIMSDDAGQFNIFQHGLCWIHVERKINALVPFSESHTQDIADIRSQFWVLYACLKAYKLTPSDQGKQDIEKKFDEMCHTKTSYVLLNKALKRIRMMREELLLVLKYPDMPLHNNLSERDIREYVKKRKISGSTRSDEGRRSRDTFASLRKTCLKLKVNFWDYLIDRHRKTFSIPQLSHLMRQAAAT
jgi:hypothetical protein